MKTSGVQFYTGSCILYSKLLTVKNTKLQWYFKSLLRVVMISYGLWYGIFVSRWRTSNFRRKPIRMCSVWSKGIFSCLVCREYRGVRPFKNPLLDRTLVNRWFTVDRLGCHSDRERVGCLPTS